MNFLTHNSLMNMAALDVPAPVGVLYSCRSLAEAGGSNDQYTLGNGKEDDQGINMEGRESVNV